MKVEIPDEAKEDLIKFQQAQQQLQLLLLQKQQIQLQLAEIEAANREIDKVVDEEIFEQIGGILIKRSRESVRSSLSERKGALELRSKVIDKHIDALIKKCQELQKKIEKYVK